jgi:hypothetical protein
MRTSEDGNSATAEEIRAAALHVAKYHLGAGKTTAVALVEAIAHVRSRAKDWNGEDELRRWLMSQLGIKPKTSGWSRPKTSEGSKSGENSKQKTKEESVNAMKTAILNRNWKREITALALGMTVGVCVGWVVRTTADSERYSIHTIDPRHSLYHAIKLGKRTGQTWLLDGEYGYWTNLPAR